MSSLDWNRRNPERVREAGRRYYARNKDRLRARGRQYYYRNRERTLSNNRKNKYGLTDDRFKDILAKQDGVCAICRGSSPGGSGKWHVDHDHITGKVRGILCHRCNTGILPALESPVRFLAEAYLARGGVTR